MIEAMGDIQLEDFDRDFLRAYESKLRTIPANRNLVKAKYGVKTLDELIAKAAEHGDKLMTGNPSGSISTALWCNEVGCC
jgi:hypothetical protein